MTHTRPTHSTFQIISGVSYQWTPEHPLPQTLYGQSLVPGCDVPNGLTMTLITRDGQELTLRAEVFGEDICFHHITGEGGTRLIGHWQKTEYQRGDES